MSGGRVLSCCTISRSVLPRERFSPLSLSRYLDRGAQSGAIDARQGTGLPRATILGRRPVNYNDYRMRDHVFNARNGAYWATPTFVAHKANCAHSRSSTHHSYT